MNQTKFSILAAILAFAITGCHSSSSTTSEGPKAPVVVPTELRPGEEATLLPLAVGNQWTFDEQELAIAANGQQRSGSTEITLRISKVTEVGSGKQVELEVLSGGKVSNKQTWLVNKDGIYQVNSGLKQDPVTPPQPLAKFPVTDGEVTSWSGTAPFGSESKTTQSAKLTTKGARLVDTEMGEVSAILFESVTDVQGAKVKGKSEMSIWFRPGAGIAKIEQRIELPAGRQALVLKLKSFTPKNP